MTFVLDANVLIALVDSDHLHHQVRVPPFTAMSQL
jgi:hypothetical protein